MKPENGEYQSDFARKYHGQGRAEGKVEGRAEGKVEERAEGTDVASLLEDGAD